MGKSLYLRDETFAEWINKVDALIQDELGYSIVELILDDSQDYGIETTQTVIFAIQVALGELLKAHGAKPGAVVGQSLGEAAAAYFAGGLSLADATRTICSRAHLMGEGEAMLFGEYIRLMALVEYSADEIKTVFSDYPDLEVCVYAAPTQTVIGGPPEQVDAIIARAESEGKFARKFQTKGASHTQQMDPLRTRRRTAGHRAAATERRLLLHRPRGRVHPAGQRAHPRRGLLEEGPAAQRVLHARRPQRRRQRPHHLPRAGAESRGAHAGWIDDGCRRFA
jgi:acyl transferase domain-containing protein